MQKLNEEWKGRLPLFFSFVITCATVKKTLLRANMKQQSFNNVALSHTHKVRTDKIRLLDVANEFVQRNENRFRNFGKLTDLDLSTC